MGASGEQAGLGAGSGAARPARPRAWVSRASTAACWRHRGAGLPAALGAPHGCCSLLSRPEPAPQCAWTSGWAHTRVSGPAELPGYDFYGCVTVGLKWTCVNNRVRGVGIVWRVTNSLVLGVCLAFGVCLRLILSAYIFYFLSKHWDFSLLSSLIIPILFFFFILFSTVHKKLLGPQRLQNTYLCHILI